MRTPAPLSESRRATLAAIAEAVVPHAFGDPARAAALVDALLARLAGLEARKRRDLGYAIAILGARPASVFAGQRPLRFERQPLAARQRILEAWAFARLPVMRSIVQSLRRLVLLVEYSSEAAQREVGYRGAYHTRGPAVPWEGALPGNPSDAEPVARAAIPEAAHRPVPRTSSLSPLVLDGNDLRADAVVIGTGAGGATAAARLAEAGLDVIIVERGELLSGADFDEREGPLFERLYADGGLRTTDDLGVSIVQGVAVGGSTTVNWMLMLRTPDWVLDEWTRRHGSEGMDPATMEKVFARIESELHARPVPDDAHSPNNRIVLDGATALGWRARAAAINARGCVRTGFCGYGCRTGAKQGTLETYLPRAVAAGARLVTHARAERIELTERGGAFPTKRVVLRHTPPNGRARDLGIEAKVVVVAAGAVGTPVLLQRSGLGGGAVGKYLRLHPTTGLLGRYDREIYAAGGIPMSTICDEFHQLDANGYGAWIETPPMHPALAATACPGIGAPHRALMQDFRNTGTLIVLTRDGADRGISNGDVRARRDGSVSIRYALGRQDRAHVQAGLEAAAQLHFAAGAREVISGHSRPVILRSPGEVHRLRDRPLGPCDIPMFSAHVNGTCRMGTDRRSAGTDPHGERFGAPGVFVADGSLLPTAPGVNPQETIFAVSTIIAERIASRVRTG
ncbi:MAG: GMC family oxidoreductase [Gemmatimonadaceae bacterium]|nr:GMC family oxidoreductase [Gemmatimonadaceae bacterium]MCW5826930.1 GMC family oxidoreductase [Gemmatimonadaceae bacterium]